MTLKKSTITIISVLAAVIFATAGFLLGRILPREEKDSVSAALSQRSRAVEIQCGDKVGTGFVYESDEGVATVVTCLHVVKKDIAGARFRFYGKSEFVFAAETLGFDENADLAVFRVPHDVVVAKTGVKSVSVGDNATLFGNSAGEGITAFFGKVSSESTVIKCEDESGSFLDGKFMPAVAINAAVNAGSSGCPVFDDDGNLVGMGFYQNFGTSDRPVIDQSYMISANLIAALVKTYEDGSKTVEKLDYTLFSGYIGDGDDLFRVTQAAIKNDENLKGKIFRERESAVYMCAESDEVTGGKKVLNIAGTAPKNINELLAAAIFYHYFGGDFITEQKLH